MEEELKSEDKIISAVSYFLFVFAIIPYIYFKNNKFIRFHALQATVLWVIAFIIGIFLFLLSSLTLIPFLGFLIGLFLFLIQLIVFAVIFIILLICAINAFLGKKFKLPLVGSFVEKNI